MKRTTTIEWTTITEDESTWPPEKVNVCLEAPDDGRYCKKINTEKL